MKYLIGIAVAIMGLSWTNVTLENEINTTYYTLGNEGEERDKKPEFRGGQKALINYMQENVVYPEEAKKQNIKGTSHIGFDITASGEITQVTIEKSAHDLLDKEAMRVIKSMPNWIPGEKNGKKVKAHVVLPVTFKF